MIKLSFFKWWLISFGTLCYGFVLAYFPEVLPWTTPKHIYIIQNIVITISSIFLGCMILSALSEDMMGRQDSFKMFGERHIWRIWQWFAFPLFIYGVYRWEHYGIIIASGIFYFGMKCLITNQNKHHAAYKQELIVRKARQETAEKVTL